MSNNKTLKDNSFRPIYLDRTNLDNFSTRYYNKHRLDLLSSKLEQDFSQDYHFKTKYTLDYTTK